MRSLRSAAVLACLLMLCGTVARAVDPLPVAGGAAEFTADEVIHDRDLDTVTARGNVEVTYGERTLLTDVISYNRRDDVVTATGNVVLHEPTGEVIFARHVELSGDLKDGIIADLRIILQDGARLAAAEGQHTGGRVTEFQRVVYSPCEICADAPDSEPLWQVKAGRARHDKERKRISYRDLWLEMGGVPVLYTPYLSHSDPTVKRQSGFLIPSFGSSSDLGMVAQIPYFWAIDDTTDLTFEPIITTDEGVVLAGAYRQRLMDASIDLETSLTRNSDHEILGHIDATLTADLNETWRAGIEVQRASGETYLRRYGFNTEQTLITRPYVEGFRGRNHASIEAFAFQGLASDDDPGTTPYILPLAEFSHRGAPSRNGGRGELDLSLLSLFRTDGRDVRRVSGQAGWRLPYTGPIGDRYTLRASLRGDAYHVNEHPLPGRPDSYSGVTGRVVPELGLEWRWPLVRRGPRTHQVIEPILHGVVSPYGGNPDKIPNEDSIDFEFDETNLFSHNRFTGWDRVEGGPRLNYGLRWGIFSPDDGRITALVGQTFRPHRDSTFATNSGLDTKFSDLVGSLQLSRGEALDLTYRTRIDKEDFKATRNEVDVSAGVEAFRVAVSYLFFENQVGQEFSAREELQTGFSSRFSRHWRADLTTLLDIEDDANMRSLRSSLTYEDECFEFRITYEKKLFRDRDISPSDAIYFRINFKTLGQAETQVY